MRTFLLSLAVFFALGLSAQTPATIYEIQGQTDVSPLENQIVTTSGIVTSHIRDYGFFLQDGEGGWNGVYVYYDDSTFVTSLNRGDEVEIIGKVVEYYEKTEISEVVSATVVSTGNAVPAAVTLTSGAIADEQYEGVLIKVPNAVCTDTSLGYGEFYVNDGSGNARIDDKLWYYWDDMTPTPDSTYQVTGVVDYSFDNYKILPRDAADLIQGAASVADMTISGLEIFPNPVSDGVLFVNADNRIQSVEVYNMIGQSVVKVNAVKNTQAKMDLSELNQGVYVVKVKTMKGETETRRIMID